jgi:hypothetical protein
MVRKIVSISLSILVIKQAVIAALLKAVVFPLSFLDYACFPGHIFNPV